MSTTAARSMHFESDRASDNEFVEAGWTVLHFTWKQVTGDPEHGDLRTIRATVARLLGRTAVGRVTRCAGKCGLVERVLALQTVSVAHSGGHQTRSLVKAAVLGPLQNVDATRRYSPGPLPRLVGVDRVLAERALQARPARPGRRRRAGPGPAADGLDQPGQRGDQRPGLVQVAVRRAVRDRRTPGPSCSAAALISSTAARLITSTAGMSTRSRVVGEVVVGEVVGVARPGARWPGRSRIGSVGDSWGAHVLYAVMCD